MKNILLVLVGIILGAIVSHFFGSSQEIVTAPAPPKGIISSNDALKLSANWTDLRKVANDAVAFNGGDNRSSWYALDDVQNYIDIVRDNHPRANGLRFYLGVDTAIGAGGYTTIFMVPTELNEKTKKSTDISGADGLDEGEVGNPPTASYPQ